MRYRRITVAGASYFFTVVAYRRQRLFAETVRILQAAIQRVQERRPFVVEAQVVLPDHLHALWTLPDDDFAYATRWRLIKEAFTREYAPDHRLPNRDAGRRAKGEQTVWQRRYWEHLIRNDRDFSAHVEYIHTSIRSGMASYLRRATGGILRFWIGLRAAATI